LQFVAHPGFIETTYKAVSEKFGLLYRKKARRFICSVKLDEAYGERLNQEGY
jgi:hypothetical protein